MRETSEPVILVEHIPEAIETGAWFEIECIKAATKSGNTHSGGWIVRVCQAIEDKTVKAVLVKARGLETRVWRGTGGLMNFAIEYQAKRFVCPIREGDKGVWTFETSNLPPSFSMPD